MWNRDFQNKQLISRKILITKPELNGKTLAQLKIRNNFGASITRVNRSGVDLVATPNLQLQMGDRVKIVGSELAVAHAEKILGNSMKRLNHPNLIPIFLGIALGCILGSGTIAWAEGETADAAAKIKVACVGDSLTEGYTSTGANSGKKGPNAYPARLQSLLGSGYEVKNFGETGAFLMEGTSNPYKSGTEYEQSKAYNADIVIIMLGTNDSKNWKRRKL